MKLIEKFKSDIVMIEVFILFCTIATLKMPMHFTSMFLPFSLWVLYKNYGILKIDKSLKEIFVYFGIFLLFFTFLSIDIKLSIKGLYDILRAFLIFLVTIVLIKKLKNFKFKNLMLFISFILLSGNYLFSRGGYYGYFDNPNNVAIEVFIVFISGLIFFKKDDKLNYFLYGLYLLVGLSLLLYANCRGILLGIFIGFILILNLYKHKRIYKYIEALFILCFFTIYFFYFNYKHFSLSSREDVWLPLINYMIEHSLFLGNGINSAKDILHELNSFVSTTHNLFLEIFVSSGLIGLIIFSILSYKLFLFFYHQNYEKNIYYYIGILGITTILIEMQFDLKFASYPFLGAFFYSLGLIYSQIKYEED